MSASTAAAALASGTLADRVDDALAGAFEADETCCLWCGGAARVVVADRWSGHVVARCLQCGSELDGVHLRHRSEGRP
jgi:hypothetical protein